MDKFEIFNNTNLGQLTAIFGDNGNIWFLTKDVAKILCMKAEHALRLVDPEDRTEFFINIGTGRRKYQCVNEYGIYEMIFASKKQEAKTFRKWVTHEVLPSIRKNGGYIIGQEELKGEEKEKLEEQIRQLAKQVNAYSILTFRKIIWMLLKKSMEKRPILQTIKQQRQNMLFPPKDGFFQNPYIY